MLNRVELEMPTSRPHFSGAWDIGASNICRGITEYFELHRSKQTRGMTGKGLDLESKNSTDMSIMPRDLKTEGHDAFNHYIEKLKECYFDYLDPWPFLREMGSHLEIGTFNVQRYDAGGHFQRVHTERSSLATLHRVLAWMTYLNDVDQGGETTFSHYGLKVMPREGLTLIWPAEWTHAHSGGVINNGPKYIITGWIHFSA